MDERNSIELLRLKLDQDRLKLDSEIRQSELAIWKNEISRTTRGLSAPLSGLLVAIVGLGGGLAGSWINGKFTGKAAVDVEMSREHNDLIMAQRQFQSNLILQSIAHKSQSQAISTLKFIAAVGLIPDFKEKVLQQATDNHGAAVPSSSRLDDGPSPFHDDPGDVLNDTETKSSSQSAERSSLRIKSHN